MTTSFSSRRTLHPGGPAARHELAVLLTSVWAGEAIRPSRFLLIAAPQLADGPALDNRAGGFSTLESEWGERVVRLSDMLLRALSQGSEVWVATRGRSDAPNLFLARVRDLAVEGGLGGRLRTAEPPVLPAAGLYGDGFALTGAVAFGDTGPDFAGEGIVFELDQTGERTTSLRKILEGLFQ